MKKIPFIPYEERTEQELMILQTKILKRAYAEIGSIQKHLTFYTVLIVFGLAIGILSLFEIV